MPPLPESPLEVDDLLAEILLRLPPQPSSLLRASLVCVRWRQIISHPRFPHRLRAHHRNPPLLGFFVRDMTTYSFESAMDPPGRIPAARFSMPQQCDDYWGFYGCRHGLAVFISRARDAVIVWDPVAGRRRHVPFPEWFPRRRRSRCRNAAVLCDAAAHGDDGHVHGDCLSGPFKLVLLRDDRGKCASAYIYESRHDSWGSFVPTVPIPSGTAAIRSRVATFRPGFLVRNALYWAMDHGDIVKLDLQTKSLEVIHKPRHQPRSQFQILRTTENMLGLAIMTRSQALELWQRKANYRGVAEWALQKTVDLNKLLPHGAAFATIHDFIEDTNMIVMSTRAGLFTIQLDSMECRYVGKRNYTIYFSYTNFYTGLEQVAKS